MILNCSLQVVWSGSFPNCRHVLQLLENDSNATNSIELRVERFEVAAIAAVDCSQTVMMVRTRY